jgi:hypothetical protein
MNLHSSIVSMILRVHAVQDIKRKWHDNVATAWRKLRIDPQEDPRATCWTRSNEMRGCPIQYYSNNFQNNLVNHRWLTWCLVHNCDPEMPTPPDRVVVTDLRQSLCRQLKSGGATMLGGSKWFDHLISRALIGAENMRHQGWMKFSVENLNVCDPE